MQKPQTNKKLEMSHLKLIKFNLTKST